MLSVYFIDLLKKNWKFGELTLELPNTKIISLKGENNSESAKLRINNYRALRRVILSGDIGLFEGYRNKEWDTDNLFSLLKLLAANLDGFKNLQDGGILKQFIYTLSHKLRPNTKKGSRKNIFAHYDLGNDFYNKWLDESMTYSSALYEDTNCLTEAQNAKYREMANMVDLKAGQNILEIGCGWGGFAKYAANVIGANVTCVTISQAQYDYVAAEIARDNLQDKIDLRLCDYRDLEGRFDAIVSIEMFEAVGEAYWNIFFDKLKSLCKPNGKIGLQIITISDDLFADYRKGTDFIQNYVFPGGMLPSIEKLHHQSQKSGFISEIKREFGKDYSRTLTEWAHRFENAWDKGLIKGFDENFRRLWRFYLAYCVAGFDSGRTDVVHLVLKN